MTPADRTRLLDAADRARGEGWTRDELPEIVLAEARRVGLPCTPRMAALIGKEASGER